MNRHPSPLVSLTLWLCACGGAAVGPPALEYRVAAPTSVRYAYSDTTVVSVSLMGQSLRMSQEGTAEYAVTFTPDDSGVLVTLEVAEMEATIRQPMGAPLRVDESDVDGSLVFMLDRTGAPSIRARPAVEDAAIQMVSGLDLAHTLFPGLPGRAVAIGDRWVDTVAYEGEEGPGTRSAAGVITYTATGDTVADGRALLVIAVEGRTDSAGDVHAAGMTISQASELIIRGWVHWDVGAGLMFQQETTATGTGFASIPIAPADLPIEITSTRRVRLLGS